MQLIEIDCSIVIQGPNNFFQNMKMFFVVKIFSCDFFFLIILIFFNVHAYLKKKMDLNPQIWGSQCIKI